MKLSPPCQPPWLGRAEALARKLSDVAASTSVATRTFVDLANMVISFGCDAEETQRHLTLFRAQPAPAITMAWRVVILARERVSGSLSHSRRAGRPYSKLTLAGGHGS